MTTTSTWRSVELTRRGRVAVAVVILAIVMGWLFGARALNAVAAPTAAALIAGWVILARSDPPTVELSSIDAGFPGEARTLTAAVSGTGLARVSLAFPDGVDVEANGQQVTLPSEVSYEVELTNRGVHEVGPLQLALRSPLGLCERAVNAEETTDVTVYPQRYAVDRGSVLARLFLDELEAERQEFDRLREYQPGDPLRHIHWKSSAKHDEFLVAEFAPSQRDETVTIVATAPRGEVDEMARIAATIADVAFDGGFSVELATPDGHVPAGQGAAHRENVLRLLARTNRGSLVPINADEADIEISFAERELAVRIGAERYSRSTLLGRVGREESDDQPGTTSAPDTEVTS